MGQRWSANKFTTLVNPFGTLYNPLSIFRVLAYALDGHLPDDPAYVEREGHFVHYDFHSDLNAESQEALQEVIQDKLQHAQTFLSTAHWVVITLGSAFVYELIKDGRVVANCHKQPAHQFRRRLLATGEIISSFESLKTRLDTVIPDAHYLFTVSPVRHLRDTLERNSVSKATLRLAVEQLCQQYSEQVHYFPSYEIMLDELRDYRYYDADMIHPSTVAEDYLWGKLVDMFLDEEAVVFLKQWHKVQQALSHRPFQPSGEAHQRFLRQTLAQLKQLSAKADVYTEITQLEQQIKSAPDA